MSVIALLVTDCAPLVNTDANPAVAELLTVKLVSRVADAELVPTTPLTLTPPVPAVRFSVCAPSIVEVKSIVELFVVTAVGPPKLTGPV